MAKYTEKGVFKIRKVGDNYQVYSDHNLTGKPKDVIHGTHPTRKMAVIQLRAMYANIPKSESEKRVKT